MGSWVCRRVENGLWEVGYYRLPWRFVKHCDFQYQADAETKVHYLNGGE